LLYRQINIEGNTTSEATSADNFAEAQSHLDKLMFAETNLEEVMSEIVTNAIRADILKKKLDKIVSSANSDKASLD
jgi:hypothetical protein